MAIDPDLVRSGRTALVINECQRMVVGDLSFLPQMVEAAKPVVANLGRLARAARAADIQVVHCVVKGRADGKGSNQNHRMAGRTRKLRESGVAPDFDPEAAAEVVPEIGVEPEDLLLTRIHGMSPMSDTGLDPVLRNLGITTVIAGGVSLNVGVTNLAMDAMNRGYDVVVPRDAAAGVPPEYGEAILANTLSLISRLTTTDELVQIWEKAAQGADSSGS